MALVEWETPSKPSSRWGKRDRLCVTLFTHFSVTLKTRCAQHLGCDLESERNRVHIHWLLKDHKHFLRAGLELGPLHHTELPQSARTIDI